MPRAHDRSLVPSGSKNGLVVTIAFSSEPSTRMSISVPSPASSIGTIAIPTTALELSAEPNARDATPGLPVDDDLTPFERQPPASHLEADEHRLEAPLLNVLHRPLADEVVLVELDDPGHGCLEGVRLGIGVLADEDVHLLEAKDPLRLEAERRRCSTRCRARAACPRRARRTGSGSGSRTRARPRTRSAGRVRGRRRRAAASRRGM